MKIQQRDEIDKLKAENKELREENEELKRMLLNSCGDCVSYGHAECLNVDENTGEYMCENANVLFNKDSEEELEQGCEGVSPEVLEFAKRMQYKLDKNKHKSSIHMNPDGTGRKWADCSFGYLHKRILEEADELEDFLQDFIVFKSDPATDSQVLADMVEDIRNECADVGNFAMMIFDNCGKKLEGSE